VEIQALDARLPRDLEGGGRGNETELGLGLGEGDLHGEPLPDAVLVAEDGHP
jgi:hypothetical protein